VSVEKHVFIILKHLRFPNDEGANFSFKNYTSGMFEKRDKLVAISFFSVIKDA
jgi:hypothetical protein